MLRISRILGCAALGLVAGAAGASTVIGLTLEDQARLSSWVVVGEIVGQRGVDHPEFGIETEVTLRVTQAFKGNVEAGADLVFHTRGGQVGEEISEAIGDARLNTGQVVLVFVEKIDGRAYNLGLSYGVFNVNEDRKGRLSFVRAIQDGLEVVGGEETGNGPFSLQDVASRVNWARTHPEFDSPMVREAFGKGR